MSKIKMAVLAVLATLVASMGVVSTATPASAGGGQYEAKECINYNGQIKTCLKVEWSKQSDGNGVRIEQAHLTTPDGCMFLQKFPYRDRHAVFWNPRNGETKATWSWGQTNLCASDMDMAVNGSDKYSMMFSFHACAVANDRNYLFWRIEIEPDGGRTWHASSHSEPCP